VRQQKAASETGRRPLTAIVWSDAGELGGSVPELNVN